MVPWMVQRELLPWLENKLAKFWPNPWNHPFVGSYSGNSQHQENDSICLAGRDHHLHLGSDAFKWSWIVYFHWLPTTRRQVLCTVIWGQMPEERIVVWMQMSGLLQMNKRATFHWEGHGQWKITLIPEVFWFSLWLPLHVRVWHCKWGAERQQGATQAWKGSGKFASSLLAGSWRPVSYWYIRKA